MSGSRHPGPHDPRGRPDRGAEDNSGPEAIAALTFDAPGVDEEASIPWPLFFRQRVERRARRTPSYPWIVTATVLFGTFCVASTITILAVSRPEIASDLHTSVASLVWLISGPTIAVALTGTTAGKLGDLHGHRRVFLVGMAGATVFVLLTALAWSGMSLIAFRVIGATVGAATGPSSLAIISRLFAPEDRSRALGFWSLVVAGGPVAGLVIGGPLVEAFGWRAIFVIQTPLLAISAVVAWIVLPDTEHRSNVHFDITGQLVLALSLAGLLVAIDRGPSWGFSSPAVILAFVTCPAAMWWFISVERRAEHPLIPLEWFGRRGFAVPVAVSFFVQFAYMGGFIVTPKMLDEIRGLGAEFISLLMIPRPLTFAIAGPVAGFLATRVSARATVVAGTASLTLSMVVFGLVAHDPGTWAVVSALTLSGIGVGAVQPRIAASVANTVDDRDLGVTGATQQLVAQVGTTLGMNVLETIQISVAGQTTGAGSAGPGRSYAVAYLVGAVVSGIGMLVAGLLRD